MSERRGSGPPSGFSDVGPDRLQPDDRETLEGQRIGPYELQGKLGSGGMGDVYRAFDQRLHRSVALKQIRSSEAGNRRARLRFQREARWAASLSHPNIVSVFDVMTLEGGDWIVMELVEGQTLDEMRKSGPLDQEHVLGLARQLAEALAAAHAQGIVHRDLKAKNVIATPKGLVKVLDFGLAKRIHPPPDDPTISIEGSVLGTPQAMSPEQALGHKVDLRSDFFSLGSLLYEMLTGSSPFLGKTTAETMARICTYDPPPVSELVPSVHPALTDLIRSLLEKEPQRRPENAEVVIKRLREIAEDSEPWSRVASSETALLQTLGDESASDPELSNSSIELGERRQVTVVCVELVDATGESGSFDPEVLSSVLNLFKTLVQKSVDRFEGHIVAMISHRVIFCFGYPAVHEDDGLRAVHAVREVVDSIAIMSAGRSRKLAVRAGIHTGMAVSIQSGDQGELALGQTLDLATGLQQAAQPDQILVSEATARLLGEAYDLESLNDLEIPGSSSRHSVLQVMESEGQLSRERTSNSLIPMIARSREARELTDRLGLARQGEGQVVLVSGEPGIGKSRLVHEFIDHLDDDFARHAAYASPYAVGSPLFLIIELLRRLLGGTAVDKVTASIDPEQIRHHLEQLELEPAEIMPFLLLLLSLPKADDYPLPELSPADQRQKSQEAILSLIFEMSEQAPMVLLLEDLHWADPSTLEVLGLLIEEVSAASLLVVLTFRPEFQPPWDHRSHVTRLNLGRLAPAETRQLIEGVTGGIALPPEVEEQILDKTDGVPLFVEKLTLDLLESGRLVKREGRYHLQGSLGELDIPTTLRDALAARLKRHGAAKQVAQLAAVIGRTASFELLSIVSPLTDSELKERLEQLVDAELMQKKGFASRRRYIFKHALIQDVAYDSMLKPQRQGLHRDIAVALVEHFPKVSGEQPGLIAIHYEQAGDADQAVDWRHRAGQLAAEGSAHREALDHLEQGLVMLESLPASAARCRQELSLRMAMGLSFKALKGYTAPEVWSTYERVRELCMELGDYNELFTALYGLWVFHVIRADRERSLNLSEQILETAEASADPVLSFQAHSAAGTTTFYGCHLGLAEQHLASATRLYDEEVQSAIVQRFGPDSIVVPFTVEFWRLWMCGLADQAQTLRAQTLELAEDLPGTFAMALVLNHAINLSRNLRDAQETLSFSEALSELATRDNYPFMLATAKCGLGWARCELSGSDEGLKDVEDGLKIFDSVEARLPRAFRMTFLIEPLLALGDAERGMALVAEAMALTEKNLETFYRAELWRLKGEFRRLGGNEDQAEADFRVAVATAHKDQTRAIELRAGISLARWLGDHERGAEGKELLGPIVAGYSEGFDTRDYREAAALLETFDVSKA